MGAGKGKADPIDAHVGSRLRAFRLQAGMNQTELARALGVTFQQVQKYERGTNRVSASRIAQICAALNVPMSQIFEGHDAASGAPDVLAEIHGFLATKEGLALVEAFRSIRSKVVRQELLALMKQIALSESDPPSTVKKTPAKSRVVRGRNRGPVSSADL